MLSHSNHHLKQGTAAENLACQYLSQQGLNLVEKNYRCQYGELDIIMKHDKTLVIVEVRFRQSTKYGTALETITHKKQSRIIAATQHYLQKNNINSPIRFDAVAISASNQIKWVKNAF